MDNACAFQVRVTGILMEEGSILLVKQQVSQRRGWSLPGGRLEQGETLAEGLIREFREETGLDVQIDRLLYLCDVSASGHKVLHVTFAVTRTGGEITLPTNEFDHNPISGVAFVPIHQLESYGFSARFRQLAQQGFPDGGNYPGDKAAIGLDA